MRRYGLTLDIKNDARLIAEYKRYHEKIWPEIKASLYESGILEMEIYLVGTRMFMVMEVADTFSFEAKARADKNNAKVQEWEQLMGTFQQTLPQSTPEAKWVLMEKVFCLTEQ